MAGPKKTILANTLLGRPLDYTLPRRVDIALVLLRVWVGVGIAWHGWRTIRGGLEGFTRGVANMGFPMPEVFAVLGKGSELVGGILLALGLLTRPAAVFLVGTMFTAAFVRHAGDPLIGKGPSKELAIMYLMPFILFLIVGPGRISIDRLLRRRIN